ncbi:glycine cleavage system H protein [Rhodococcus sp. SMB37]|uniref:glycine cleavage system protein GcvH n=1 Tax=Rhodococcus sp. SMB37 TaxID=2512213 RepID=UPI00104B63D0|nr:glycine cleavage system protein GcvH [Rhodococcus sp. SMB37]TCN50492.1 glycine cleavage system H protein [Rhodococcus sp. SMB37]
MSEFETPADLRYTAEHEWVQRTGATTARVGITDYAQSQLGDVVFVQLPDAGSALAAGDSFGEVESTKSVSDVYAPFAATVAAVNGDLEASPELVNSAPYAEGWLIDVEANSEADLDAALEQTLDAAGYRTITEG